MTLYYHYFDPYNRIIQITPIEVTEKPLTYKISPASDGVCKTRSIIKKDEINTILNECTGLSMIALKPSFEDFRLKAIEYHKEEHNRYLQSAAVHFERMTELEKITIPPWLDNPVEITGRTDRSFWR